jgi:pyruvate kinase
MVARGDLGVELNIEDLPNIQRQIVRSCAIAGKPVIVATHLLESMIENPIPTRAEVTDVANAVYEEVDAIMLSGETTVGKYPLKCIEYLDKVARASEKTPGLNFSELLNADTSKKQLARSAVKLADDVQAAGIIVITKRGKMAGFACHSRPKHSAILAFTFTEAVRRQMALLRGVNTALIERSDDAEQMISAAFSSIKARNMGKAGDLFVVISDVLIENGIDAIQLRKLSE